MKPCQGQGQLTEQSIVLLINSELQALNSYRALHGCHPLSLSPQLNHSAQKYSQHLYDHNLFQHSDTNQGENLYRNSVYWNETYKKGRASEAWHAQHVHYNFQTGKATGGQVIGHFTAMVWRDIKEVGFGFYWGESHHSPRFMKDIYVTAHFMPPPNIPGQYIKNVPPPLKKSRNQKLPK